VDLDYSPREQAFRAEVREWLGANLTDAHRALADDLSGGGEAADRLRVDWERTLGAAGWIGLSWPKEYGGRAATLVEQMIFGEEYARAGAPLRPPFGESLLGPTLIAFGTDEQRRRFLPPILRGDVFWCQGFSEPEAGSDLAGVRTRAVLDGDHWVIDGQKVWTSQAQTAQWIFVLARTDPDVPKHRGLSFLLVPLDQPGVEIRPIRQITGTAEFNEVYFTGARTDAELVVGGVDNGWRVTLGTLSFERGTAFLSQQVRWGREFGEVVAEARRRGKHRDPAMRQRLADAYCGLQIIKYTGFRTISGMLDGGLPGPEASIGKLFWSQWHQRLGQIELDLLGDDALTVGTGYELAPFQQTFLFSRAHTIYAGSSEVQRGIVGERVLGLPKEPSA
jgi:alkylation response protein AidB-like acyl-CoA dehydrogenase